MISLITSAPKISNDISDIIRLYYGLVEIVNEENKESDITIYHNHSENGMDWQETFNIKKYDNSFEYIYDYKPYDISDDIKYKREIKRSAKLGMYYALKKCEDKFLPWGALTGIRPTRLYRMLEEESKGNADKVLQEEYDVSRSKLNLLEQIIDNQKGIYRVDCQDSVDLYIGIPFCPTRCVYCSFISYDLSKGKAPLDEYTEAMLKEIGWFNSWRKKYNKKLRSVYVGGGTPTSIGVKHLDSILSAIEFDGITEFTVEAGRPDTINKDMLDMLQKNGVNRISINPQSMNIETLKLMNRPHTPSDIIETFKLTKSYDFIINMDLIMGLYGETIDMVKNTLEMVEKFDIDNLTIHTLAIKRSSELKEKLSKYKLSGEDELREMVENAHQTAKKMKMTPYYMYRQKYMSGNLENVGFSLKDKQCIYNIDIMEETHNLIALGAGAVSKRMYYDLKKHARIANNKSIIHYIENIEQLLLKKDDFFAYN